MKSSSVLLLMILFISCSSNAVKNKGTSAANSIKDSVNKQKVTDEQMAKGNRPDDEPDLPPTLAEERKRIINQYDKVETIDTTMVNGQDKLKLLVKYYCLKDGIITVPKRYQDDEKPPTDFITHPFASTIILTHNGDTVLNRQFKARDFFPFFEDSFAGNLKKHGSILMPELSRSNKDRSQIVLAYSVAIPATDIGKGLRLVISKDGNYKIIEN